MSETPLGRFTWYELLTTDPESAPAFYGEFAGWTTEAWEGAGHPYTQWMNGETPIGGVMTLPDEAVRGGAPSHWLVHISTPDLAATKSKAVELGADVLHEIDIPSVGSFAVIKDPQGAVFSAFQPVGEAPGHDGPASVGGFSWHELSADDWEREWDFYSLLFGWRKAASVEIDELGTYQMFDNGADPLGGMFKHPPDVPGTAWLVYIRVPDVDVALDKVRRFGGTVLSGPMDVPDGDRVAQCLDPQGAAFAVHEAATG